MISLRLILLSTLRMMSASGWNISNGGYSQGEGIIRGDFIIQKIFPPRLGIWCNNIIYRVFTLCTFLYLGYFHLDQFTFLWKMSTIYPGMSKQLQEVNIHINKMWGNLVILVIQENYYELGQKRVATRKVPNLQKGPYLDLWFPNTNHILWTWGLRVRPF